MTISATSLTSRELTYAGVNIINPSMVDPPSSLVVSLLKANAAIRVTEVTPQIDQYNRFAAIEVTLPCPMDYVTPSPTFVLPTKYKSLNIAQYTEQLLLDHIQSMPSTKQAHYINRYEDEFDWFVAHARLDMLRTMVYVVDTLELNSIPWGVGRGSSVASYLLFLIGVHDIDPVEYNLDWHEFLRDEN